ncbi:MAG: MoaD/ThiS family protein [Pirellulaceae bacterium]|nr:MoaD/ThiS family protein [Pirellulaceae bacterium]
MPTQLLVPRVLQPHINYQVGVELSGETVAELLVELQASHPALYQCICQETGQLRKHIHLFINNDLVSPAHMTQVLEPGDVVSVFQAVSGG